MRLDERIAELEAENAQQREQVTALHVRCLACHQVTAGVFPAEAPSRAQYGPELRALAVYLVAQQFVPYARARDLLADFCGVRLSAGTVVEWVQQSAETLEPIEENLKAALQHAPILHSDEPRVRRGGWLAWTHVASTARLTHYAIHAKRGSEATSEIGILPSYTGVSVHDGWKPYQAYTTCRHALCNVHHLRELNFVEEQYPQPGANDLKAVLLEMRLATEQAQGQARLPGNGTPWSPVMSASLHWDWPPTHRPSAVRANADLSSNRRRAIS